MADRLSAAQLRHLGELVEIAERGHGEAYWTPGTSGEWAVARALERRGLLQWNPNRGQQAYEFSLATYRALLVQARGDEG